MTGALVKEKYLGAPIGNLVKGIISILYLIVLRRAVYGTLLRLLIKMFNLRTIIVFLLTKFREEGLWIVIPVSNRDGN